MENAVKLYNVRCPNEEMALRIQTGDKNAAALDQKFFKFQMQ